MADESMDLKARLLAKRSGVATEEVEIDGVGVITVRGLSRAEFLAAQKRWPDDTIQQERYTLSRALVDPVMTEQDVKVWQENSDATEINKVSLVVNRLSGIKSGADKEAYKSTRD